MRKAAPFIALALLSGCVTTLGPVKTISDDEVRIIDHRADADKKNYRASVVSPVILLGDENFEVSPLLYLKEAIARAKPASLPAVELEVTRFRVVDYFPARLGAGMSGAVGAVVMATGVRDMEGIPTNEDSIVVVVEGKLNGKDVHSQARTPYKISPLAGSVRSDPGWVKSAHASIDACAEGLFSAKP